jgi:hypothetical protein
MKDFQDPIKDSYPSISLKHVPGGNNIVVVKFFLQDLDSDLESGSTDPVGIRIRNTTERKSHESLHD